MLALGASAHCLTGCAIGEVIGTALGWGDVATIALAVALAFFFSYLLTMLPRLRPGAPLQHEAVGLREVVEESVRQQRQGGALFPGSC